MAVFNGTTSYGKYAPGSNIFTTLPFSVCGWFKTSTVQAKDLFGLGTTLSALVYAYLRQNNGSASGWRNGFGPNVGGTFPTDGTWCSLVMMCTDSDTTVWLDGVQAFTDPTNIAASDHNAIMAGGIPASTPTQFFSGSMAHLSIHSAAFTLTDAQSHAAGTLPSSLPSPWAWYPLLSHGNDLIGGRDLTLTDVTFDGDQPAVISYSEAAGTKLFNQALAKGLSSPLSAALNKL